MSERESASERVLCVLGIKLMFQPLWLALVALQYYSIVLDTEAKSPADILGKTMQRRFQIQEAIYVPPPGKPLSINALNEKFRDMGNK